MSKRAVGLFGVLVVLVVFWSVSCGMGDYGYELEEGPQPQAWSVGCKGWFIDAYGKPRAYTIPNCSKNDAGETVVVAPPDETVTEEPVAACIKTACKGLTGKTRAACNQVCKQEKKCPKNGGKKE